MYDSPTKNRATLRWRPTFVSDVILENHAFMIIRSDPLPPYFLLSTPTLSLKSQWVIPILLTKRQPNPRPLSKSERVYPFNRKSKSRISHVPELTQQHS